MNPQDSSLPTRVHINSLLTHSSVTTRMNLYTLARMPDDLIDIIISTLKTFTAHLQGILH